MTTEMQPARYEVLCSLTVDEYLQMAEEHRANGRQALLFDTTEDRGAPIFEDDLTLIVRDALIAVETNKETIRQLRKKENRDFDATRLPVEIKLALMDYAKRCWNPPHPEQELNDSHWTGEERDAHRMLYELPELRLIFERTPEEVSEAFYARRQS